ncbi:hypothetical protein F5Y14DRAFT_410486 [Nemania sp. NC0429]|nr:hypothetical protein F5Y14DRAFT_410486 [Nemania sp. NC0429]
MLRHPAGVLGWWWKVVVGDATNLHSGDEVDPSAGTWGGLCSSSTMIGLIVDIHPPSACHLWCRQESISGRLFPSQDVVYVPK